LAMDYPFLVKTGKSCNCSHGKEIHDSFPNPSCRNSS
jgi:hypothetical protein